MIEPVFVDSFAWIAAINKSDNYHEISLRILEELLNKQAKLITTNYVVVETHYIWGSVLGAAVLVILPEALRFLGMPSSIAANMRQIIYGALLVIFMLFRPQGFIGEYSFKK